MDVTQSLSRLTITIEVCVQNSQEIHKSPKRLQRMRLALQKYNLEVQYKKGPLMYIADAP